MGFHLISGLVLARFIKQRAFSLQKVHGRKTDFQLQLGLDFWSVLGTNSCILGTGSLSLRSICVSSAIPKI
jgi:hypothetical protein